MEYRVSKIKSSKKRSEEYQYVEEFLISNATGSEEWGRIETSVFGMNADKQLNERSGCNQEEDTGESNVIAHAGVSTSGSFELNL